jgi:molybdopterin-containing oxidoreductase family membrane subunit
VTETSRLSKLAIGVAWVALAIFGGLGVLVRFTQGHEPAAYGSYVVWGLWVASYIFFIGLSAGAFLLSSLVYVFGVKQLEPAGKVSLFVAVVTLLMALLTIFFDLGRMWRFYRVFTNPNFGSMMAWMVWLYTAYFLLVLAELWMAMRPDLARQQQAPGLRGAVARALARSRGPLTPAEEADGRQWLKVLGGFGVPLAVAFHGGVGSLFATISAHPYWGTPLMPILFLTGALVSGGGLLAFVVAAFWPRRDTRFQTMLGYLGRVVVALLALDMVLEWAEFSIPMWYGVGPERNLMMYILFGPFWYVFWGVHLLMGTAIPLYLLLRRGREPWAVGSAGLLVAATFLAVRLNMVIPALITPNLSELQRSFYDTRLRFTYVPSLFEWQLIAGMVAFGVALFYVGQRYLPLMHQDRRPAS